MKCAIMRYKNGWPGHCNHEGAKYDMLLAADLAMANAYLEQKGKARKSC